jgi:hypothetical protein
MSIRVLDPTAEEAAVSTTSVSRLASLEGRTVGLLDNGKLHVHELLDHVEAMLRSQYGVADVLRFKKSDASRPMPPEVLAAMEPCEAIISAVGD